MLAFEPLGRRLIVTRVYDHHGNVGIGAVPLLVFDAWERAYCLQYRNVRSDHLAKLWSLVNWADAAPGAPPSRPDRRRRAWQRSMRHAPTRVLRSGAGGGGGAVHIELIEAVDAICYAACLLRIAGAASAAPPWNEAPRRPAPPRCRC